MKQGVKGTSRFVSKFFVSFSVSWKAGIVAKELILNQRPVFTLCRDKGSALRQLKLSRR
jgi:hypothetical protein